MRVSRHVSSLTVACAVSLGTAAGPLAPTAASQTPRGVATGVTALSGTRRAVVVGVSRYRNLPADRQLSYAAADAELFARLLRSRAGGGLADANLRVLLDSAATNGRIWDALRWLRSQSRPGDVAIIYFAGHGDVEEATGSEGGFLLAHDAPVGRNYPAGGAVDLAQLQRLASSAAATGVGVVLVTDACRAGKLVGSPEGARSTTAALAQEWARTVKLISTNPDGLSYEDGRWGGGHGVFTWYLVRGMLGEGRVSRDGLVHAVDLSTYLTEQVRTATDDRQIPLISGGTSLALAMRDSASRTFVLASAVATALADASGARDRVDGSAPPFGIQPGDWRALPTGARALVAQIDATLRAGHVATPDPGSAWALYQRLDVGPRGERVQARVASTLAAALQDGAQRIVSEYLAGRTAPAPVAARQAAEALARAQALLGRDDPTARSLQARRLFLEGYALYVLERPALAAARLHESLSLEQAAYSLNALGAVLRAAGQADSAERVLRRVIALAPQWAYPYNTLGVVELGRKRYDEAERQLRRAIAIDPAYAKPYYNLARVMDAAGRTAAGDSVRRVAMRVDPETVSSLLSDVYLGRGDSVRAEAVLREAIDARPRAAITMVRLADLYSARGRLDAAEAEYRAAVAADSTIPYVWDGLGTLHFDRFRATRDSSRLDSAIVSFRRAVLVAPTDPVPYRNLGEALAERRQDAAADSALAAAVALDSTDAKTFGAIGHARADRGQTAAAEAAYRKAVALNPTNVTWYRGLASVYRRTGRTADAERTYSAARDVARPSAGLLADLGDLYAELHRVPEAERAYRDALNAEPTNKRAKAAIEKLRDVPAGSATPPRP